MERHRNTKGVLDLSIMKEQSLSFIFIGVLILVYILLVPESVSHFLYGWEEMMGKNIT